MTDDPDDTDDDAPAEYLEFLEFLFEGMPERGPPVSDANRDRTHHLVERAKQYREEESDT